jgi:tRNA pseudouridine13 synthase
VSWAKLHRNKLRPGHLVGNRFRILVRDPVAWSRDNVDGDPAILDRASAIAQALADRGVPNFFGSQRFGLTGDNAERGRRILVEGDRVGSWQRRFFLSAYQSALFNLWLTERMRRGWYPRLLEGDIAKKTDTGGLFLVEDIDAEEPRWRQREIVYTGPIYGSKMRWPEAEPGQMERNVLAGQGVTDALLDAVRLAGSRRRGVVFLDDLQIEPAADGLWFAFALPKGSYATTVLREFMKVPLGDEGDEGSAD